MILGEMTQKLGFQVDAHQLEGLHERLEGINNRVKVIAGIEVAHAMYELAERFAGLGEHLESTAIAAGLTTTQLQKLQFAASQNAVGGDQLAGALARLNRQLYSAKNGGKQAQAMFAKLGITPGQLAKFATSADALSAVQDRMKDITDANERQAITMQLFGRGGSNMIKFLVQGSKATSQLGMEAERMGAIVSTDGVKSLAEFEDAASGLAQVFKSFMANVASQLAPAFIEVIHMIERAWGDSLPMMQKNIRAFAIKAAWYIGYLSESFRLLVVVVSAFAEDHPALLGFLAKWGPVIMVAVTIFSAFVETLTKIKLGWVAVAKYAPKGWGALIWGISKLQVFVFNGMALFADFLGLFSPALAAAIEGVALAIAGLGPLEFAAAVVAITAAIAALTIAAHDLYAYFFTDTPYEKLWIARLLKWLEPLTDKIGRQMAKLRSYLPKMLGGKEFHESDWVRPKIDLNSPLMVPAAEMPIIFNGTGHMAVKHNAKSKGHPVSVSNSFTFNQPIQVLMPPGTTAPEAVQMLKDGVHKPTQDMLQQAYIDAHPAAAR